MPEKEVVCEEIMPHDVIVRKSQPSSELSALTDSNQPSLVSPSDAPASVLLPSLDGCDASTQYSQPHMLAIKPRRRGGH
eukprot:CAMPEP_0116554440 /NCGR_PEP_ID=MMETSP0397-20121206/7595_1 /TAXON_ID=216820 /ORGANISM="Cyclophora tenuis, Strain ECT3854" /LENGTH=78 /DNA_ID=CAMNT_0004079605 /DNA_START=227 /DNA_END=463 /DNA_ORIENTATION=-